LGGCGQSAPDAAADQTFKTAAGREVAPQPSLLKPRAAAELTPKPLAENVLTPEGLGTLRVGMSRADAAATGLLIAAHQDASEECEIYQLRNDPESWAMFLDGRLTRISIEGKSRTRTQAGLRLGSKASEVLAAYGPTTQVEPHAYDGPEAHYLTIWTKPKTRGLRFEINAKGVVEIIHGGDQTIQYVEGCS
jgi:hypothetical protein